MTDESYEGEVLGVVRGTLVAEGSDRLRSSGQRVAILWFSSELTAAQLEELEEEQAEHEEDAEEASDILDEIASCSGPRAGCSAGASIGLSGEACYDACEARLDESNESMCSADFEACVRRCPDVELWLSPSHFVCAQSTAGTDVAVRGEFPAKFQLDLFDPPPASSLLRGDDDGPAVALGLIALIDDDYTGETVPWADREAPAPKGIHGVVETHALIYAAEEVPQASNWGKMLQSGYGSGYHLIRTANPPCVKQIEEGTFTGGFCSDGAMLSREPQGFAAEVTLRVGPFRSLEWPQL